MAGSLAANEEPVHCRSSLLLKGGGSKPLTEECGALPDWWLDLLLEEEVMRKKTSATCTGQALVQALTGNTL